MIYNQSLKYFTTVIEYVWMPKSARALKTLNECTVKNGDMLMTSRNGCNNIFLLQLTRWATKAFQGVHDMMILKKNLKITHNKTLTIYSSYP